jgi:hypothetical protein
MPRRVIVISAHQLQKMINEVAAVPKHPLGPCLTDSEAAAYVTKQTERTSNVRGQKDIEEHTESCIDCCDKLLALFDNFNS